MLKFTVNKDISQAKYMASDDLESGIWIVMPTFNRMNVNSLKSCGF